MGADLKGRIYAFYITSCPSILNKTIRQMLHLLNIIFVYEYLVSENKQYTRRIEVVSNSFFTDIDTTEQYEKIMKTWS